MGKQLHLQIFCDKCSTLLWDIKAKVIGGVAKGQLPQKLKCDCGNDLSSKMITKQILDKMMAHEEPSKLES